MSRRLPRYCPRERRLVSWGRAMVYGHRVKACQHCGAATKPREPKAPPRTLKPLGWKRAAAKAIGSITSDEWQTIVAFYGGLCCHCEKAPWTEQEHFVPVAKGGKFEARNMGPSCHACNQRKGRQTWYPRRRHPFMESEEATA